MQTTIVKNTSKLNELKSIISQGISAFQKAGNLMLELLEENSLLELHEATDIPMDVLAQLERIGRRQLNPALLLSSYPAALAIQRMPVSDQDKLLREPVEVLMRNAGKWDTMLMHARNLTPSQVRQVFAKNYLRPIAEQRSYLESLIEVVNPVRIDLPYEINSRRHTVLFRAGCEVTRAELARLVAQLQD